MREDKEDPADLGQAETNFFTPAPELSETSGTLNRRTQTAHKMAAELLKKLAPWLKTSSHRGSFLTAALITVFGLIASIIHPILGAFAITIAAYVFLSSPGMMVVCLACFPLLTSLNAAIFLRDEGSLGVQLILITGSFVALSRLVIYQGLRPGKLCLTLAVLGFAGGLFGAFTSTAPGESILSAVKFVAPLMPLMFWADQLGRRGLGLGPSTYAFAGVLAAATFGSLVVLMLGQGQSLNKTDFQGLFWHPQTCGLVLGLACIFSALLPRLPNWLRVVWFLAAFGLMLLSWTRTAVVALIIAALLFAIWMAWQRWQPKFRYGQSIFQLATFGIVASLTVGSAFYASTLKPADYVLETSKQLLSEEAYAGARTFALYRSYANFAKEPVKGIGFGVPSDARLLDPAFAQETTERIKMGLGSEVLPDKGNAFLAALEESGVVGATLWLGLFAYFLALAAKSGPVGLVVGAYLTISNLAEATLFSLGGVGMTLWIGMIVAMSVKQADFKLTLGGSNLINSP